VRKLKKYVDGVIVASALIDIMKKNGNRATARAKLSLFVKSLRSELDG